MAIVTMKALLESGVHFGHRTHRWHPLMKPYIFSERNGIHIINLQLTVKALQEAHELVRDVVAEGGTVLFVGTKRQAQDTIEIEAMRCGMPYVTARWLGGMLTNYRTIRERINELDQLERRRDSGEFDHLTKREVLTLSRKIEKLATRFSGTRKMAGLPELLFAVDVRREETAIHEANLLEIPVVAMVDTNCDPRDVDYIIPSNDDAIRAIKLVVSKMADAVLEGKALRKEEEVAETFVQPAAEEAELTDEELLGEATLAKLRDIEIQEEEAAAAAELAAEESAEAAVEVESSGEEAPAEVVEEAAGETEVVALDEEESSEAEAEEEADEVAAEEELEVEDEESDEDEAEDDGSDVDEEEDVEDDEDEEEDDEDDESDEEDEDDEESDEENEENEDREREG